MSSRLHPQKATHFVFLAPRNFPAHLTVAPMTDSIQWYYYADAAPPAPPRAPCNDRTHAGAVFEGTPFSYHLKGDL